MTRLFLILLILIPGSAFGQNSNDNSHYGYLSAGGGLTANESGFENGSMMVAGGGEIFIFRPLRPIRDWHKRLAVGGEIGIYFPPSRIGSAIGVFSPNVSWHFPDRTERVSPFITGGYSLFFRNGQNEISHGFNFGGGAIWWFRDDVGLRLEARDFIPTSSPRHLISFRAGVAFR